MEENIYDYLGLTPKDDETIVKEELEAQIKKWTNQLTRSVLTARAKDKLEILKHFKAELDTNPNMLKEHAEKYIITIAQKKQQQEKSIIEDASIYVVNGQIEEAALAKLTKKNTAFTKEEILSILGATIKKKKIFGINFGTTYSNIAYVDEYGKPVIIPNKENNSPVTPSVVFFELGGGIYVGDVAKQALESDPDRVCSTIKRQMGNADFVFNVNGTDYNPEAVSALILKKLAVDASELLGEEVKDVVITYPSYFGPDEKIAIKQSAEIAGLNFVRAIPEPIAAAYSYGLFNIAKPQMALIYDLGGASFDVTVVRTIIGHAEVVATGGDHYLGGKDWDAEIQKYAIEQYVQQGGNADDIYDDIVALGDLALKSEQAKKQLSQREKTSFRLNGAKIEISVDQFEKRTAYLLQSSIDKTKDVMHEAAAKGVTQYDKILLVGGSTFMPQVKKRLGQEFAGIPIEFCDPNEAIAKGAAIYGMQMLQLNDGEVDSIAPPVSTVPVLNKGIALSILHNKNSWNLQNVFNRNTPLPCAKLIHTKTTFENQREVSLGIYEYDSVETCFYIELLNDIRFLVLKTVYFSKPLPINSPIDIMMQVNNEGLLTNINVIDVLNDNVIIVEL